MHVPTYVSKNVPIYVIIQIDPTRTREFILTASTCDVPNLSCTIKRVSPSCHKTLRSTQHSKNFMEQKVLFVFQCKLIGWFG